MDCFDSAPERVKQIIIKVLELEKQKLEQVRPRLNAEIVDIIKHEVQGEPLED
jgi:hypothetical protein